MVKGAETTARAVRFYEMQKLIRPAKRSPGGHRLFTHSELDKLRLVLDLRTCGLSIEEIREVLQAKSRGATVREAALTVQGLLFRHVKELQRKIAVIERLHREFDVSQQVLDRCVHCTDPRGPAACPTCEVPKLALAPPSFHQIWAIPSPSKNRPEPDGQVG
jgi:DNA-binding transcriptional MerR regulator